MQESFLYSYLALPVKWQDGRISPFILTHLVGFEAGCDIGWPETGSVWQWPLLEIMEPLVKFSWDALRWILGKTPFGNAVTCTGDTETRDLISTHSLVINSLESNSWFYLHLPRAGISDVHHQAYKEKNVSKWRIVRSHWLQSGHRKWFWKFTKHLLWLCSLTPEKLCIRWKTLLRIVQLRS